MVENGMLVEQYVRAEVTALAQRQIYLGKVRTSSAVWRPRSSTSVSPVTPSYIGEVMHDEEVEGDAHPRIDEVLQPGQSVLVQVTKDPMGTKGARLTTERGSPGTTSCSSPGGPVTASHAASTTVNASASGTSRSDPPAGYGLIIRTAAEGVEEDELARDLERLTRLWSEIDARAQRGTAPVEIYVEPDLVIRVVRDLFSKEFERLVVEDKESHERMQSYLRAVAPELVERLSLHEGPETLFEAENVVDQMRKALERKVWLPSGGYIVIDRAEALTVIDVNTGRYVGKTSLEDTVVKTNLEAAAEVVRQLRLRDIGGIIIIDFIDMLLARNREQVLKEFRRGARAGQDEDPGHRDLATRPRRDDPEERLRGGSRVARRRPVRPARAAAW